MQHAEPAARLPLADRIALVSSALPDCELADLATALTGCGLTALELTVGSGGHVPTGAEHRATRAGQLRRLHDAGITICGAAATAAEPLGGSGLARALEVGVELRAPFLRVFAPPFDPDVDFERQLAMAGAALSALDAMAAGEIAVLLEPAEGTIAASPELARRLIENASGAAVGVVYDPGSLVIEGHLESALALAVLDDLVAHVHVKNRALVRTRGRWRSEPRALAAGRVDWADTLRRLATGGYGGWLSIDHLSDRTDHAALRTDVATLRRIAHTAEFSYNERREHVGDL